MLNIMEKNAIFFLSAMRQQQQHPASWPQTRIRIGMQKHKHDLTVVGTKQGATHTGTHKGSSIHPSILDRQTRISCWSN